MNVFEIFFLLLTLFLTFWLGVYFVGQIGWLGVLPAVVLGCGLVGGLLVVLTKFFGHRGPETRPK